MLTMKSILCPVDFGEPSSEALAEAARFARFFGAELWVMHVTPYLAALPYEVQMATPLPVPLDGETQQEALSALRDMVQKQVPEDVKVHYEVRAGDAAEEIVKAAEELKVDLLIISTHGLTGWRHFVFGSVAEAVVRTSTRPVLTLRAAPPSGLGAGSQSHVNGSSASGS